ncbi:replicative helicase loader/inhibitor [Bacillus badius]|uniref:replicative helicase loader/inhibitor n=1 Tax=Bacillus badius TaxID=1455 RepID=UPI002E1D7A7D|nr:replicative helicase loader/inhibitor [Bacillus badius]
MDKQQVFQILQTINAAYARFEVTDERLILWSEMLQGMDYSKVNARLKQHIKENRFPPSISEISVYEQPANNHLEKVKQWEREGAARIERDKNRSKPTNPYK